MVFPICCLYERCAWRQQDFISDPNAASLHHRPWLPRIRDMMKPYETIVFVFGRMVAIVVWHMLISQGWNQPWCHTCGSIMVFPICCLYERCAWRQQDFISDPNAASLHYRPWLPRIRDMMKPYETIVFVFGRMDAIVVWHMLISQGWNQPWCHTCGSIMVFPICCLYERCAWRQQDFISDPNAASLHHRPWLPRIRDIMKPYETIVIVFGRMVAIVVWHMFHSPGWNQPWCHTCGSIRHFFIGSIDPAVAWAVAADSQHPRV